MAQAEQILLKLYRIEPSMDGRGAPAIFALCEEPKKEDPWCKFLGEHMCVLLDDVVYVPSSLLKHRNLQVYRANPMKDKLEKILEGMNEEERKLFAAASAERFGAAHAT